VPGISLAQPCAESGRSVLLEDYLDAIQWKLTACDMSHPLDVASKLGTRHMSEFCFSSIGVLLKRPLPLEPDAILRKFAKDQSGGYCFEHNKLFYEVLNSLGMKVTPSLARVLYDVSIDNPQAPKTHRITLLQSGSKRYVVDVGFGARGPKVPVEVSSTPTIGPWGERYRVIENQRGDSLLQVLSGDKYFTLYSFDHGVYNEADFEMSHFYSYSHPSAGFVNNLVVAKNTEKRVLSLRNNRLWMIESDSTEEHFVESANQLRSILNEHFGIFESQISVNYLFNRFCRGKE